MLEKEYCFQNMVGRHATFELVQFLLAARIMKILRQVFLCWVKIDFCSLELHIKKGIINFDWFPICSLDQMAIFLSGWSAKSQI